MADRVAKLMIRSIGNCPNRLGSGKCKKLSLVCNTLSRFTAMYGVTMLAVIAVCMISLLKAFTWFLLCIFSLVSITPLTRYLRITSFWDCPNVLPWRLIIISCPTLSSRDMAPSQVFTFSGTGLFDSMTARYDTVRTSSCSAWLSCWHPVVPTAATIKAMPHRARRKNWFISPRNSLLLMQYDSYGPLYVFLSTHTHSSPFDPNSMILYYTLYNSSFPHDKSKFLYWILIIGLYSENSWILYK